MGTSRFPATMAPSPRPVGVNDPAPMGGKTARPTIHIRCDPRLRPTLTVSPTLARARRREVVPRTISFELAGGLPSTIVGYTAPLKGSIPIAGTGSPATVRVP